MKKNYLALFIIAMISIMLVSFSRQRTGSVSGSVNPPEAGVQVWLLSANDTLHGAIKNGVFQVTGVKPGTCALVVDAVPPFKRTTRTAIEVFEGSDTNVGEILLEQVKSQKSGKSVKSALQ